MEFEVQHAVCAVSLLRPEYGAHVTASHVLTRASRTDTCSRDLCNTYLTEKPTCNTIKNDQNIGNIY